MKLHIEGTEYHVKTFEENNRFFEIVSESKAEILYYIYGLNLSLRKMNYWLSCSKVIVFHWIGTDVLRLLNQCGLSFRTRVSIRIKRFFLKHRKNFLHLVCAPWLREELSEIGIFSHYLPITTLSKSVVNEIDDSRERDIDFLSYVPQSRFNFYGGDKIAEIAKSKPNRKFVIIVPDAESQSSIALSGIPNNVMLLSRMSFDAVQELMMKTKVFLRLTKHDGLSLSVLEAMNNACQVLWTYQFPFVIQAKSNTLSEDVSSVVEKWIPNIQGRNYVRENFQAEVVYENLQKTIRDFYVKRNKREYAFDDKK